MTAVGHGSPGRSGSPDDPPATVLPHPPETFSALVVDDEPQVRAAMTARLATMGAARVDEAASVAQARACADGSGPYELAILALSLPGGGVLDLLAELRTRGWPRVAVLATANDPRAIQQAIMAGAHAYLLKPARPGTRGDRAGRPAPPTPPPADSPANALSAREIEVLRLVADGQSNKEIGAALALSALTVKSHLSRVGRKLNTGDRAEMVALAMRSGMIQ